VTAADGAKIKVSVVIPVYNTRPYLAECLDSVLAQDLPSTEFEVVVVDDGSTDGSGELLDHYCDLHQNVRVIHQVNSGWPGKPRNVGRAASRGAYVFFADSDDCLAPEALRRMYDFAVAHDSDVVVPKNVPLHGPSKPDRVWRKTQVDADLARVLHTLGPWKLFRREFLDEQGIWFPEGRVRLEDGIFVTEAYLTAHRVSQLADYDYYLKRVQQDRGNISSSPVDPDGYMSSIARMIELIRRNCADDSTADALVTTLYRRKVLKWFAPDRFPSYQPAHREAWVEAVRNLQDAHVPPRLDDLLPLPHRTRSLLVRHNEVAALISIGASQRDGRPLGAVLVGSWVELHVPGLVARPALVIAPGVRLVPAEESSARAPLRTLVSIARHRLVAVARRTSWGRQASAWAKKRHRDRRSG
jgi:glycosyltransferase involved in cell wall biosynthesis